MATMGQQITKWRWNSRRTHEAKSYGSAIPKGLHSFYHCAVQKGLKIALMRFFMNIPLVLYP